jgi:hypothetical protein
VEGVDAPLSDAARLALCGGVALYLAGHVAFAWRMGGGINYTRLGVAAALLALFATGSGLDAWGLAAVMTGVMAALCALEAVRDRRPLAVHIGERMTAGPSN